MGSLTRRRLLGGAAAAAIGGVLLPESAAADYRTMVDPGKDYGAWDGWGASLAWWATA